MHVMVLMTQQKNHVFFISSSVFRDIDTDGQIQIRFHYKHCDCHFQNVYFLFLKFKNPKYVPRFYYTFFRYAIVSIPMMKHCQLLNTNNVRENSNWTIFFNA